jgi:hypothetical protein
MYLSSSKNIIGDDTLRHILPARVDLSTGLLLRKQMVREGLGGISPPNTDGLNHLGVGEVYYICGEIDNGYQNGKIPLGRKP